MENKPSVYVIWDAKISLGILLLSIFAQCISMCQTYRLLKSPLIPDSIALAINKEYLFHLLLLIGCSALASVFYFYKKYWFVIAVLPALVGSQFIIYR
jgi:hypothetical protein